MNILRTATTAVAISIAGAGLAVGATGLATADDTTPPQSSTTSAPLPGEGPGPGHGHGPGGGPAELATGLADALDLQESDVAAALEAVHEQLEPETSAGEETRAPLTPAEQEARQAELASALAGQLDLSEQVITDALDSLAADRMAEARSLLSDRLDTAVSDGDLTKADKESVLKAFDAGVLGGPHGPEGDGVAPTPAP